MKDAWRCADKGYEGDHQQYDVSGTAADAWMQEEQGPPGYVDEEISWQNAQEDSSNWQRNDDDGGGDGSNAHGGSGTREEDVSDSWRSADEFAAAGGGENYADTWKNDYNTSYATDDNYNNEDY